MAEEQRPLSGEAARLAEALRDTVSRFDRLIREYKGGALPVAEVVARLAEIQKELERLRDER